MRFYEINSYVSLMDLSMYKLFISKLLVLTNNYIIVLVMR